MKSLIFLAIFAVSTHAMAELPIVGTWYNSYSQYSGGAYSPESLTKIASDGTYTWEVLFPDLTQKQVFVFRSIVTADSIQTTTLISQTDCGTNVVPDPFPRKYTIEGDSLKMNTSQVLTRASQNQIQKFSNIAVGCN